MSDTPDIIVRPLVNSTTTVTVSQGFIGPQGPQGETGPGVPDGGTTGQVLVKVSGTDQDTEWTDDLTVDSVTFDITAGLEAESEGELVWDTDAGTIDLGMNDGVTQRVGEDLFYRVQVVEAVSKGDLLMAVGTVGNSGLILAAKSTPTYNGQPVGSQNLMGLAAADIAQDERGYAIAFGRLRKFDTTDFEEGDILWADPANAGGLTVTRPEAPNWKTIIALVITKSELVGSVQIRPTFGSSLANDELAHINGVADNDILRYNQTTGRFETEALDASGTEVDASGFSGLLSATDTTVQLALSTLDGVSLADLGITATDISNWNTAYGWGDHATAGYLTSETVTSLTLVGNTLTYTDENGSGTPIDLSAYLDEDSRAISSGTLNAATGIVTFTRDDSTTFTLDLSALLDDTNLVTSVNGNVGVVVLDADDISDGLTNIIPTSIQETNWDTAYSWGDHSTAGYLTSFTETDPTVPSHVKAITTTQVSNWDSAYGWGDHALEGYLTSFTETDPTVPSHVKSITTTQLSNWDSAYSWGDHATAGYLTSETVTSLTLVGNTLTYTDENGSSTPIDLSAYLDEDSRAIASGVLNGSTGIVTFTRDDSTTFTLDLSALLDDTNLVTSVNGQTGVVVLDADDIADGATNIIPTATQETNWDTAYSWGDHNLVGYVVIETDPTVPSHVKSIAQRDIDNWDDAYSWGDHSLAGYLTSFTETDPVFTASPASGITSTQITNWDTAYGWGDHALAGYLTSYTESDPVFSASASASITGTQITNWDTAYGWGDHALAGYLTSYTESDPVFSASPAGSITSTQVNNWDTAYGWGDHALVGYLTSFTESDPVFSASPAGSITSTQVTNWDTAYGWGDHALAGYLTSFTESDPVFTASAASGITGTQITNWDNAYSWGDHSLAGYLTSFTESDPTVGAHIKAITTTQISNWDTAYGWGDHASAGYLTSFTETDPVFTASPAGSITSTQVTNWDTAYSWGDHASAGYLTSYTETDPTVGSHIKAITTTQISNWDTAYSWGDHSTEGYLTTETVTSLSLVGNTLTYTDENGSSTPIDLSAYLDEDSRAIASGTLNAATGIVTFTRDDATTFTLDLSALLDDTNLVTSVNGQVGVVVLDADDIADGLTNIIPTATQESNWDTAYGWGDHSTVGYLTSYTETDPVFTASAASGILSADITNWNNAYSWGDHALAGYLTSFTESDPTVGAHIKAITSTQITNWDTAYSWGDHSTAGYLTSFTETDPTVGSHIKAITTTQVSNWDTAYGWGDHATVGYLTSYTESDPVFSASAASGITSTQITNWDTAYGWGDHALAGYLTSYTETDTLDSVTGRGATTSNNIRLNDNAQLQFGSDNDLRIYHNGSSSLIEDIGTGDLILRSSNYLYLQSYTGAENYLVAGTNTGVSVYYDNLKKLETVSTGVAVTGVITATGGDSTDWNTAYGWGDHASVGYLTSYTETDPVFTASPAGGITSTQVTNWDTAYGWGDHSAAGYLTGSSSIEDLSDVAAMTPTSGDVLQWNGSAWANAVISTGGLGNIVEDTTPQLGGTLDANGNIIDMGVNTITDTKVGQWDTAYGWGDHSTAGYLTSYTETDPVFLASAAGSITGTQVTNWDTAYGWGDHSTQGYLTSYTETDPVFSASAASGITSTNITNWNTAYGWGDHAAAGYLTSFTETDPVFTASAASGITSTNISNWNTAYGWGDHASAGYLTSYTETDPVFSASAAGSITGTQVTNWDTAYGWGDHASAGYLTSYTESDPTVGSHIKAITTTQISNWDTAFGWGNHASAGYLTSYTETDPVVGAVTGIVKADGAGNISAATAGTDYQAPLTAGTDYLAPAAIGVTVQGYDADTAKYDDTTANFTGTLQENGNNVVTANEVGTIASQNANNVNIDGGNIDGTAIGASSASTGKFSALTLTGEIDEQVFALSGTTPSLDPANGTIQTWTLSGNSTPTDSLTEGESILLLVDDGTAYTITWPTMEWIGGSAPTLDTANTNVIELWKVGSTLYGALVGVSS